MDGQGVSDDGDKKALLINHQSNKHKSSQSKACEQEKCHKQINRKKGSSFKALKQSVGKYWGYLSHFNQSRAEGIPGDFQQQQDEKIRLSKPAPLTTKPPQARLLRENRYRVKSGKQIRLKKPQKNIWETKTDTLLTVNSNIFQRGPSPEKDHIIRTWCNGKRLII